MSERPIDERLDRLAPPLEPRNGWDDVLARARRIERRRRRRVLAVTVAAAGVLAASVAAASQIGSLIARSSEPHLLLRAELRRADGTSAGTLELELQRAIVTVGGGRLVLGRLMRADPPGIASGVSFPTRWFLETEDGGAVAGTLYLRRGDGGRGSALLTLCAPCGARDSGRIGLSWAQASALVNGRAAFAIATAGAEDAAAGPVHLVRSELKRGVECRKIGGRLTCRRIYTGRP